MEGLRIPKRPNNERAGLEPGPGLGVAAVLMPVEAVPEVVSCNWSRADELRREETAKDILNLKQNDSYLTRNSKFIAT